MWRRVTRGLVIGSAIALLLPFTLFAQQSIGFIEKPAAGQTVSGMVLVQGWALDPDQVARVDLYVDDQFQHSANINIPRIDVIEAYPDWEGIHTRKPGFQTGFLASRFSNGTHTIHAIVTTSENRSFEIGRREVTINNTINQSPFGAVDIPDTSSVVDVNGSFPVVGWAADTDGIARVEIVVDDLTLQSAMYGDERPDVANAFPDLPAARFSGYVAYVDTSRIQDGVHRVLVRAIDRLGMQKILGSRTVQLFNSTNNLRPFGYLDEPRRDAELWGNCGGAPPPVSPNVDFGNKITLVKGWALDLGTREDTGRVAYAELMVDGVPWYSTDDCAFVAELGAKVNCYGLTRFDVARYYPTYADAPNSGFLFTLDVGTLIKLGVPVGRHVLKVRVGDQEQTFAEIPGTSGIPVTFSCIDQENNYPSVGYIDFPTPMEFLSGTVTFHGWALEESGTVQNVEIMVDGQFMGFATYGLVRPDVRDAYPTVRNSIYSGWRFNIDTTQFGDGRHRLSVVVLDFAGDRTIIGSTDFYTDNPN
jgi:N-acetylmuramoyl-L-alanine amidase